MEYYILDHIAMEYHIFHFYRFIFIFRHLVYSIHIFLSFWSNIYRNANYDRQHNKCYERNTKFIITDEQVEAIRFIESNRQYDIRISGTITKEFYNKLNIDNPFL